MTDRNEFQLSLIARVPVPTNMVDAIWWQMKNDPAYKHLNEHLEVLTDELRIDIACNIADELRGLVYSVGRSIAQGPSVGQAGTFGKSFAFTVNKQFTSIVEDALLFRLWHKSAPKTLLDGGYDWYVAAVKLAPELFREAEWELAIDGAGDIIVGLTELSESKPEVAMRRRAKGARYGENKSK